MDHILSDLAVRLSECEYRLSILRKGYPEYRIIGGVIRKDESKSWCGVCVHLCLLESGDPGYLLQSM